MVRIAAALVLSTSLAFAQAPGYAGSWLHFDEVHKRVTISKNKAPWLPVNPNAHIHIIGEDEDPREVSIECSAFNADCVWLGFNTGGTAEKPAPLKKNSYITTWVSSSSDGVPIIRPDGSKIYQKQGASITHRNCSEWTEQDHCTDIRFNVIRPHTTAYDYLEVKVGGEEGDALTVGGILNVKDRITVSALPPPDTPPPGKAYIYFDGPTKQLCVKNDTGRSMCF